VYYNAQFTGGSLSCSSTAPSAKLTLNFTAGKLTPNQTYDSGLNFPTAISGPTLLPYEKPYHFSNLIVTTLLGGLGLAAGTSSVSQILANAPANAPAKLDSVTVNFKLANTALFLANLGGLDTISDFFLSDLNADLTLKRAYNSPQERIAYLQACDGKTGTTILTWKALANCTQDAMVHTFSIGHYGRYFADDIMAPDKAPMSESMTINGLNSYTVPWTGINPNAPIAFNATAA
jgi:hypothetical protein